MSGPEDREVEALFHRLVSLAEADRAAALAETARREPALAAEVATLLAAHGSSGAVERLEALAAGAHRALGAAEDHTGRTVRQYRVGSRVGQGGMGVVYRARDARLDREVALKFLPPWLGADPAARDRFVAEARIASALDHPNVCTLLEIGETDQGELFLAMPYYEGETLKDRLARGPLPEVETIAVARQVASGLAAAHERGIVHRDIKPGNLLLLRDGSVKILDFGIAKLSGMDLTRTGELVGTLRYMAPEQASGEPVDGRADLWALGAVLHEMLTGRTPVPGRSVTESLRGCRPELAALIERLLRASPAERPPDARAVLRELDALAVRRTAPRAVPLAAVGLIGVTLLAGLLFAVARGRGVSAAAPRASAPAPVGAATVAVFPFRAVGEDATLWREGIVDLLSFNLEGTADLRKVDPNAVVSAWRRAGGTDDDAPSAMQGLGVARELKAGYAVFGSAVRAGDRLRLTATVFDVESGRLRGSVAADGAADSVLGLVDALTVAMLREALLPVDDSLPVVALHRLTTTSLPALRAYLEGERAYRRAQWRVAERAFRRAIEHDSSFARAHLRLASSAVWLNDMPAARQASERARQLADALAPRDRMLVLAGRRLGALDSFTRQFPDDVEGWFAYGDRLLHAGGLAMEPASKFRDALERAVRVNPHYGEAYIHLMEDAAIRRDSARMRRLLEGLESVDRSAHPCPGYRLAYDLEWGTPAARARAEEVLDTAGYATIECGWVVHAIAGPAVERMERFDVQLMSSAARPLDRYTSLFRALQARLMRGEVAAARRLLVRAGDEPTLRRDGARFTVVFHLIGFRDSSALPAAAELMAQDAEPEDLFWLGMLAAEAGRTAELDGLVRRIEAAVARLEPSAYPTQRAAYGPMLLLYDALRRGAWERRPEFERVLASMQEYGWRLEEPAKYLRFSVGRMLFERGDYEQAERYFRSFYHYDWAWYVLAQAYLGRTYEALGRPDDARRHHALVVDWWAGADPELQPVVRLARERLEALAGR